MARGGDKDVGTMLLQLKVSTSWLVWVISPSSCHSDLKVDVEPPIFFFSVTSSLCPGFLIQQVRLRCHKPEPKRNQ